MFVALGDFAKHQSFPRISSALGRKHKLRYQSKDGRKALPPDVEVVTTKVMP
jgi:hypothetical protein